MLVLIFVPLEWLCVELGCLGDPSFLHLQGKVIPPVPIGTILCSMGGVATSHIHATERAFKQIAMPAFLLHRSRTLSG